MMKFDYQVYSRTGVMVEYDSVSNLLFHFQWNKLEFHGIIL